MTVTMGDLYERYTDLCGAEGPILDRDEFADVVRQGVLYFPTAAGCDSYAFAGEPVLHWIMSDDDHTPSHTRELWIPTHVVRTSKVAVMLEGDHGPAYTFEEWSTTSRAYYEKHDDGQWYFLGERLRCFVDNLWQETEWSRRADGTVPRQAKLPG